MKPSRFAEVSPVTERMIQEINQGSANRTLFNLARFIPGSASPCFYGFCDSAGLPCRFAGAASFGWTPFSIASDFVGDTRWVTSLVSTAYLLGGEK